MPPPPETLPVTVGLIANPVSARDIRRIVANAGTLQISDRVNIVLRALATLAALGVERVAMMPDKGGISAMLLRHCRRETALQQKLPAIEFLPMPVTATVADTFRAAALLREQGARGILVLGGDGTHRAVVRECRDVPIAGLSTGTNNAFPEMRESTVTALALGLHASGRIAAAEALAWNKLLEVSINEGEHVDIALVDAVVSNEPVIGSRALWKTESLAAVHLAFADPQCIGLSAIGGLLEPVGRREPGGLSVRIAAHPAEAVTTLLAPIAPGMLREVPIAGWQRLAAATPAQFTAAAAGVIALDGEREMAFAAGDRVRITLHENAFPTVDVARCLRLAAQRGLVRRSSPTA